MFHSVHEVTIHYIEQDAEFLSHLTAFPGLRVLKLNRTPHVNDYTMQYIGTLKELRELIVWDGGTELTDEGIEHLTRRLKRLESDSLV